MLARFGTHTPKKGCDVWCAPSATVIGDVVLADGVSIWPGAVLRGDVGAICVGRGSNIQDLCMLHTTDGKSSLHVGADVTVGHRAILHGCTLHDGVLVGMGATILDHAIIGESSIVGANALVLANAHFEPRSLIVGSPAQRVRALRDDEIAHTHALAKHYRALAKQYADPKQFEIISHS